MTDDIKKRLTLFLGECWHDNSYPVRGCGLCGSRIQPRRTFTTWPDLGALMEKLVERKKWGEFREFAWGRYQTTDEYYAIFRAVGCVMPTEFEAWLFTPTRFASLVGEYLEGRDE